MKDVIEEFNFLKNIYGHENSVVVFMLDKQRNERYGVTMRSMEYRDNDNLRVYQDDPDYPYDEYFEDEVLEGIEYTEKMLYELQWGFWSKYNHFSEYMINHYSQYFPLYDGIHHMKIKSFNFVKDTDIKHLDLVCQIYLGKEKHYSIDLYNIGMLDLLTDYMKQGLLYEKELQGI